jgi:2-polyprenyl-6-methoxyphenol hydroxylase-like FAD-dependent oxidoreductase
MTEETIIQDALVVGGGIGGLATAVGWNRDGAERRYTDWLYADNG